MKLDGQIFQHLRSLDYGKATDGGTKFRCGHERQKWVAPVLWGVEEKYFQGNVNSRMGS